MKISLGNLENSRLKLSEKDMEHLRGGGEGVRCGCLYANSGGATHQANHDANKSEYLNMTGKILCVRYSDFQKTYIYFL